MRGAGGKTMENTMRVEFDAKSVNEGFARVTVAAFLTQLDPTVDEIEDVKTAVSEAVTNAIIHGYENMEGKVCVSCSLEGNAAVITVEDKGVGMEDVKKAMEPFYTTKPQLERSGMGFAFMEAFMDDIEVASSAGKGTKVTMRKKIGQKEDENQDGCGDSSY